MAYTVVFRDTKTVDPAHQREILAGVGAEVRILDEKTEAAVEGAHGLVVDAATPVTTRVLAGAETLRVVGRAGIGVDNVDVAAAAEHGITVVNVPDYALEEVSTHAFALLLACVRAIPGDDRSVRAGEWDWRVGAPTRRMAGRTLGLVGFGGIARRLAAKVRTFGLEVIASDPYVDATTMRDYGVERVSFEAVLDRADYLSVHAPLYEETRGLLSTAEFERLDDDCSLVNTARGPVVDEAALVDAFDAGELARAGLDVRASEPPGGDDPLRGRGDVVCTPHAGWYSEESRADLSERVARDVAAVLRGEEPANPVDPETPWV